MIEIAVFKDGTWAFWGSDRHARTIGHVEYLQLTAGEFETADEIAAKHAANYAHRFFSPAA